MAGLSELLLTTLEKSEEFDSVLLATELCIEHEKIVGAVKSLQAKGNVCFVVQVNTFLCCSMYSRVTAHR